MRARLFGALLCLVSSLATQTPSIGGTEVISPTVVVTWFAQHQTDGSDRLLLVILWRGKPAWWDAPGGVGAEGRREWIEYGRVHETFSFDPGTNTLRLNDQDVALHGDNVVYVDRVDDVPFIHTSRLNPRMPGTSAQIGLALRDSPEIVAYLQCDARSGNPRRDPHLSGLCVTNLGRR